MLRRRAPPTDVTATHYAAATQCHRRHRRYCSRRRHVTFRMLRHRLRFTTLIRRSIRRHIRHEHASRLLIRLQPPPAMVEPSRHAEGHIEAATPPGISCRRRHAISHTTGHAATAVAAAYACSPHTESAMRQVTLKFTRYTILRFATLLPREH